MKLTQEQKLSYFEKGWLEVPDLFEIEEMKLAQASFDSLKNKAEQLKTTQVYQSSYFVLDQKAEQIVIKRIVWAGGYEPYLLKLGQDPRLTSLASQLLESNEIIHLLNQAHFKNPKDAVTFGWHQDIQHRDKGDNTWNDVTGNGSYVQTAIIIDEMKLDNGPLKFIPNSPSWGKVDFGDHSYDSDYKQRYPAEFDEQNAITIEAKPGSVVLFGPYTVHGSFENESEVSRRILINGYAYPGANNRIYPGSNKGVSLKT